MKKYALLLSSRRAALYVAPGPKDMLAVIDKVPPLAIGRAAALHMGRHLIPRCLVAITAAPVPDLFGEPVLGDDKQPIIGDDGQPLRYLDEGAMIKSVDEGAAGGWIPLSLTELTKTGGDLSFDRLFDEYGGDFQDLAMALFALTQGSSRANTANPPKGLRRGESISHSGE